MRLEILFSAICLLVIYVIMRVSPSHHPQPSGLGPQILRETPQQLAENREWELRERDAGAAKARKDWAGAEADYRAETRLPRCPFLSDAQAELGLMQEYQGKKGEAFGTYRKAFGIGSHRGPSVHGNVPEIAEAAARCGIMCEDRGRHADACECYYTARHLGNVDRKLVRSLSPDHTSPLEVRRLLFILLHDAQEENTVAGKTMF